MITPSLWHLPYKSSIESFEFCNQTPRLDCSINFCSQPGTVVPYSTQADHDWNQVTTDPKKVTKTLCGRNLPFTVTDTCWNNFSTKLNRPIFQFLEVGTARIAILWCSMLLSVNVVAIEKEALKISPRTINRGEVCGSFCFCCVDPDSSRKIGRHKHRHRRGHRRGHRNRHDETEREKEKKRKNNEIKMFFRNRQYWLNSKVCLPALKWFSDFKGPAAREQCLLLESISKYCGEHWL